MLFKTAILEGIRDGSITLAFRRWPKPRVKEGGEIRTALGVIAVTGIKPVDAKAIGDAEARKAGYAGRAQLLAELAKFGSGDVFRIGLRFAGRDPRVALREKVATHDDAAEITRRLQRLDKTGKEGPWTQTILALIARHPGVRAADLASELGWETQYFKIRVRKLKELGLTESLDVGYRVSPRGTTYLRSLKSRP